MSWGVIETFDDDGEFIAYHVVPMVNCDGEEIASGAHDLSESCPCGPFMEKGDGGWDIWQHHDPDFEGALPEDEWLSRKKQSQVKPS